MEVLLPQAVTLLVVGLVIWGIVRAARPVPLFAVHIRGGEPQTAVGTASAAFLARVREVAAEHRMTSGRVWGVVQPGGRISLKFSGHFPRAAQQQLRNWWGASGWSVPVPNTRTR